MRVLAEAASLNDAIPRLLRAVAESLGLDRGEYWQIDPASGLLDLVHDWSAAPDEDREFAAGSRKNRFARGVSLTGRVWELGRPAWTGDLANDDHFDRSELAARAGLCAAVGFPIASDAQTIGVMMFLSRSALEMDPTLEELLTTLGRRSACLSSAAALKITPENASDLSSD